MRPHALLPLGVAVFMLSASSCRAASAAVTIPDPAVDVPLASASGQRVAVLAGGCFWGIQAVFEHVQGVISATSGYSGGTLANPDYDEVSSGSTGHAETVRIVFDPSKITFGRLLKVFFAVAHDPTELDRQGPDVGTQYRSAIFYTNAGQQRVAEAYIRQLDAAHVFGRPIVTQVVPFQAFYEAEAYHQDFAARHPDNAYIVINDAPKVANLARELPDLYTAKAARP
ncbi:MAG: peptide-methionine (S)-S-oxide reductase MsrA [Gemmatimonadota bacterium]|nr:peptide-methionine (S)-S-oxide reductase MsrA [Gemmatimonadota bacterium]MDE3216182.1 peptide-methionine (S)-S-oxide reductase MsrA [Gemmatimonadota bacterium]